MSYSVWQSSNIFREHCRIHDSGRGRGDICEKYRLNWWLKLENKISNLHKNNLQFSFVLLATTMYFTRQPLRWRHNDHAGVSNHQPHGCLLNRLFGRRSKKTSKPRVTGLCAGNSPGPVNTPHKGPVTRKMFPFDDVIMIQREISNEVMTKWSKMWLVPWRQLKKRMQINLYVEVYTTYKLYIHISSIELYHCSTRVLNHFTQLTAQMRLLAI